MLTEKLLLCRFGLVFFILFLFFKELCPAFNNPTTSTVINWICVTA